MNIKNLHRILQNNPSLNIFWYNSGDILKTCLDKVPRLSISIVMWILSSDTICQLNQFNTNSEAAILSSPIRQYWITLKLGVDPKQIEPQFVIELHALHIQRRGLLVKAWSTRSFTNQRGRFWIPVVWFSPLLSLLMRLSLTPALCFREQRLVKHDLLPLYRRAENWKRRCWQHQFLQVMLRNKGMIGFLLCIYAAVQFCNFTNYSLSGILS